MHNYVSVIKESQTKTYFQKNALGHMYQMFVCTHVGKLVCNTNIWGETLVLVCLCFHESAALP